MATKGNIDIDKDDAVKPFLDELKTKSPGSFKATIRPGAGDPPPQPKPGATPDPRDRIGALMRSISEAPEVKQ